jgi:hypothetical protein
VASKHKQTPSGVEEKGNEVANSTKNGAILAKYPYLLWLDGPKLVKNIELQRIEPAK